MRQDTIDIYARQSREDDDRQRSPEGQVADCRAVLVERGLIAGEVLIDPGTSAWNPRVRRPQWETLMRRLEDGAAAGVIVFDLERFTRQPKDGERLIDAAERGLIVLDSDQQYDLMTASGKKSFRDALSTAAYYSDRLSARVTRGKRIKAAHGEPSCASRPFGFIYHRQELGPAGPGGRPVKVPGRLEHHPVEGPVLREMVARVLAGENQDTLIADLDARGVRTSFGRTWTRTGLRAVLLRPLNTGQVEYHGQTVAELPGEPLISRADHDRITAMFTARRRGRPESPKYLCSGGAAVCGLCGKPLHGRPRTEMRKYPDGEVRRQYWCGPSPRGCMKISIDQRALDGLARALVIRVLSDPEHAAQIEAAAAEHADEAGKLDSAITAAEELGRALADRLGREEITLDRYDAATGPLDRRLAGLRAQRKALAQPGEPVPAALSCQQWEARWEAADPVERRRLLRLALRGKVLRVGPADMADRTNVTRRVTIGDAS